jgi:acetyl-CoA acetyltransferase
VLSNQFTLDSIGGVMKSCDLRLGDSGVHGLVGGVAEALSDPDGLVVVASVLLDRSDHAEQTIPTVEELSFEPVLHRPIIAGAAHPEALVFGLAARAYLARHGLDDGTLDDVAAAESGRGDAVRSKEEIARSPVMAGPLRELHVPPRVDVAAVAILTARDRGRRRGVIRGVGCGAVDALGGRRNLGEQEATAQAAARAYRTAGVSGAAQADRVEVYNPYAIDGVLAVEALGVAPSGGGVEAIVSGGSPVNPTGGVQGAGWARGTSGLLQAAKAVQEMSENGDGGLLVCQSWGSFAGSTAAVAVIETGKGGS